MAERVKKLLDKVRKTGQEVYGTKDTPFRTGIKVALDAGTGFQDLKTNLGIKALRKLLAQVNPNSPQAKEIREEISRRDPDKPPSADTRRMQEESTQNKINRANEEGVQESKTLPKTPATPAGRSKPSSQGGPRMGSTAKAGAAAERGALAGRRRKGKVTVEEVQKRAKGGMVKKKTSARKKPRGVGAATRGYGRALR